MKLKWNKAHTRIAEIFLESTSVCVVVIIMIRIESVRVHAITL